LIFKEYINSSSEFISGVEYSVRIVNCSIKKERREENGLRNRTRRKERKEKERRKRKKRSYPDLNQV
jgi:hypothetical protein